MSVTHIPEDVSQAREPWQTQATPKRVSYRITAGCQTHKQSWHPAIELKLLAVQSSCHPSKSLLTDHPRTNQTKNQLTDAKAVVGEEMSKGISIFCAAWKQFRFLVTNHYLSCHHSPQGLNSPHHQAMENHSKGRYASHAPQF